MKNVQVPTSAVEITTSLLSSIGQLLTTSADSEEHRCEFADSNLQLRLLPFQWCYKDPFSYNCLFYEEEDQGWLCFTEKLDSDSEAPTIVSCNLHMPSGLVAKYSVPRDLARIVRAQKRLEVMSPSDLRRCLSRIREHATCLLRMSQAALQARSHRSYTDFVELNSQSTLPPADGSEENGKGEDDHARVESDSTDIKPSATAKARPLLNEGRTPASSGTEKGFRMVPDLEWDEIIFSFVSDTSARINARGLSKKIMFAELGFSDGRRSDHADTRWAILMELAVRGEISWKSDVSDSIRGQAKAAVKDIRRRLRDFFGIDNDPFHPYRQLHAYRPKFTLQDERQGRFR